MCRMAQCRGWRLRAMLNVWTIAPAARECPGNPILKVWSSVEDSRETIKHKPRSTSLQSRHSRSRALAAHSPRHQSPRLARSLSLDSQHLRRRTHWPLTRHTRTLLYQYKLQYTLRLHMSAPTTYSRIDQYNTVSTDRCIDKDISGSWSQSGSAVAYSTVAVACRYPR